MFENIVNFFKKMIKKEQISSNSKNTAKERLHLVLVQDRANVSADFLELMKQEIIDVIKKYIEVDENLIDVRLTNHGNEDGTTGAPALYANIPIKNIKETTRKVDKTSDNNEEKNEEDNKKINNEIKDEEKRNNEEDEVMDKNSKTENSEDINKNDEEDKETVENENNKTEEVEEIKSKE